MPQPVYPTRRPPFAKPPAPQTRPALARHESTPTPARKAPRKRLRHEEQANPHRLPAPRWTLWAAFLLAAFLSLVWLSVLGVLQFSGLGAAL